MDWSLGIGFWEFVQICALWAGIDGLVVMPLLIGALWYCDWKDDIPINFCFDAVTVIATPFAWIYAIVQLIILYRL